MDTKSFRSSAGTDSRLIFISIYVGIVLRVHDIMLRRHSRHNSDHTLFEEKIDDQNQRVKPAMDHQSN